MAKKKVKSNIAFMPVVESISRKFALRRETCATKNVGDKEIAPLQYMGSGTRTRKIAGYGTIKKNYFFMRKYPRNSIISVDEQMNRTDFLKISKWNRALWKNLQHLTENQEKWNEACEDISKTIKGVSAAGYETYRGWSFAIGMALIKDNPQYDLTNYELPAFDA